MKRDISDSVTVNSKNRSYGLNYNLLTVWPKLIPTLAGVSITPLIGGGYSWMKSPEFCERGNTNLTITSLKSFSRILSGSVGLNIEKTFFAGKTKVTPNCSYNYTMTRQLGSKETSSMLRQVSTDVIGSTRQKFDRVHSVTSSLDLKPSRHLSLGFFAGYTKSLTQKYHAINGGVKFSWIFGAKEQKAPTKKLRL
jgi:hypothetical protein